MRSVLELARSDLREMRAYVPAAYEPGLVRLNANAVAVTRGQD
jgi:hypothetical protein